MPTTQQIAVRLPADLVDFVDAEVKADHAASRADLISRALRREKRRVAAERDAAIYAAVNDDPDDLDGLARHARSVSLDVD